MPGFINVVIVCIDNEFVSHLYIFVHSDMYILNAKKTESVILNYRFSMSPDNIF